MVRDGIRRHLSGDVDRGGNAGRDLQMRASEESDHDALYDVCVRTGCAGGDASGAFRHPNLLGDVFVGPYLACESALGWVVANDVGVQGYILGATDTRRFEAWCERNWWPQLRRRYEQARADRDSLDAWLLRWIDAPPTAPALADEYPAHVHVDLTPPCQGGGWGGRLVRRFIAATKRRGVPGVHVGVDVNNSNAVGFYRHLAFDVLVEDETTVWMGLRLS